MKVCPNCEETISQEAQFCTACGAKFLPPKQNHSTTKNPYGRLSIPGSSSTQGGPTQRKHIPTANFNSAPVQSKRSGIAFSALFLGFTGIHKFQTGKPLQGFLYLLGTILSIPIFFSLYYESGGNESVVLSVFSYANTAALPGIISTIEAIRYFCLSNAHFKEIYGR